MSGVRKFVLFEILLRLYPRRFRARYGDEMRLHFAIRHRQARAKGPLGRLRLWRGVLLDLPMSALDERRSSSFRPTHPRTGSIPDRSDREPMLATLLYDLRMSFRFVFQRPGFAALVISTLALGIGANTAIFTVVDSVLLSPLPFADQDRLIRVHGRFDPESGFDFPEFPLSEPELLDLRAQAESLESVAGLATSTRALASGEGDPERISVSLVTPGWFPMLGASPVLGRTFTEEEGRPGGAPVVVLSHGLWNERFAADPAIVGREIRLDNAAHRVIGVMPPSYRFPASSRLWLPLVIDSADPGGRASHYFIAIGRLRPAVPLERASRELEAIMSAWSAEYPEIHTGHYLFYRSLREDLLGDVRPMLLTLLAASGFVLLLACANVGAMFAARARERAQEVALRSAIGAGRRRIITMLLLESMVLAGFGGLLGLGLAHLGLGRLLDLQAAGLPRADAVQLDLRVLGFTAGTTVLTVLLCGLLPALRASRASARSVLGEEGHGAVGGWLGRASLVAVEVALCFVLVLGAGLMVRSLEQLLSVDRGFATEDRLVGRVSLPEAVYDDDEIIPAFERIADRMTTLPGVAEVAIAGGIPLLADYGLWDFEIEGQPSPGPGEPAWSGAFDLVSPGFFGAMGIERLRGRTILASDHRESEPVVVINRAFAERYFAGQDPLERRIRVAGGERQFMRIVGVVENAKYRSLDQETYPRYYGSSGQWADPDSAPPRTRFLLLRLEPAVTGIEPAVRAALREIDPELPMYSVQPIQAAIATSTARSRFTSVLLGSFALVALGLGASGTYGVLAYAVARRRREMGVRQALGASPRALLGVVVRQGMAPVALGLLLGALAALALSRLLSSQLYGVSPNDPVTWVAVLLILLAVGLAACLVPALRVFRLDPVVALRP